MAPAHVLRDAGKRRLRDRVAGDVLVVAQVEGELGVQRSDRLGARRAKEGVRLHKALGREAVVLVPPRHRRGEVRPNADEDRRVLLHHQIAN